MPLDLSSCPSALGCSHARQAILQSPPVSELLIPAPMTITSRPTCQEWVLGL